MIAELRAMKKAGGAQEHEIQKVKKQMEKAQDALADQKEVGGEVPKSVKPGDLVHIASMDVDAIIVAPVDSKGYVQLKVGMMKMRAPLSDLRTLTATQQMVKKEQKKLERRNLCGKRAWTLPPVPCGRNSMCAAWRLMRRFRKWKSLLMMRCFLHSERSASFMEMGQGFCAPAFRIVCVGIRA